MASPAGGPRREPAAIIDPGQPGESPRPISVALDWPAQVQMTIGAETHERLRRAQALLRHTIPDGDVAVIFDQALVLLLERLERRKLCRAHHARETERWFGERPRPGGKLLDP